MIEMTFLLKVASSTLGGAWSGQGCLRRRTAWAGASLVTVVVEEEEEALGGEGEGFMNWLTDWRAASLSCSGVVWERLAPDPEPFPLGPRPLSTTFLEPLELDLKDKNSIPTILLPTTTTTHIPRRLLWVYSWRQS